MNIEQFKMFFNQKTPIELAFGYTPDRNSLHIILYDNKVSRIETDIYKNVIYRKDFDEQIQFDILVECHKRFYPDRVNEEFYNLLASFGIYLTKTNTNSKSTPIFEFGELIDKLEESEVPKKYFTLTDTATFISKTKPHHHYFIDIIAGLNGIYLIGDARKNYEQFNDDLKEISKEHFNLAKSKIEEYRQLGDVKITPKWAISKNGTIKEISEDMSDIAMKNIELLSDITPPDKVKVHQVFTFYNESTNQEYNDTFLTEEEAILESYREKFKNIKDNRKFFIAINDEDADKYWVYYREPDMFENETEMDLDNEFLPEPTIRVNKQNFIEIEKHEYMAIEEIEREHNVQDIRTMVINKYMN